MISLNHPHISQFQRKNWYKMSVMTLKNVQIWKKLINCKRGAWAENSWNPIKFILSKYLDEIFWITNFFIMVTVSLTDLKSWRNICTSLQNEDRWQFWFYRFKNVIQSGPQSVNRFQSLWDFRKFEILTNQRRYNIKLKFSLWHL